MPARDMASLMDIVQAARQVLHYVQDVERNQLARDDEKQAAILYRLIIMGEATKRISPAFRDQHPEVPWRRIAGLRDIVIHNYGEIDFGVIWNVIDVSLPELLELLEPLLPAVDEL